MSAFSITDKFCSAGSASLDGLEVGNDGTNLVGVKLEFRHIGVAGDDAFAQGLFQSFDRIMLAEGTKRHCVLM